MADDATVEEEAESDEGFDPSPEAIASPKADNDQQAKAEVFEKAIVGGHRGMTLYKKGGLVKKTISVAGLHMVSCRCILADCQIARLMLLTRPRL